MLLSRKSGFLEGEDIEAPLGILNLSSSTWGDRLRTFSPSGSSMSPSQDGLAVKTIIIILMKVMKEAR